MAISISASNTVTPTIGSPVTLENITTPGHYTVDIDVSAMLSGDSVTVSIQGATLASGTSTKIVADTVVSGAPPTAGPNHLIVAGFPVSQGAPGVNVIFTQTSGTARAFPWAVLRIDA